MNDTSRRATAAASPVPAKVGEFRAGDLVLFKEGAERTPALILHVSEDGDEETLYTLEYVGWRRSWNTEEPASSLCSRRPGSTTHKRTLLLITNTRGIVDAIETAREGTPYRISNWVDIKPISGVFTGGVGKVIDKCFRPVPDALPPGKFHLSYFVQFALKKNEKHDNWFTDKQIKRKVAAPEKTVAGRGDVFNNCKEPDDVECEDLDDLNKLRGLYVALETGKSPERRNQFEVETILARRNASDGGKEYKVRWARHTEEHDTWEPESHFENASEQIEEWKTRRRAERKQQALLKSQQEAAAAKTKAKDKVAASGSAK